MKNKCCGKRPFWDQLTSDTTPPCVTSGSDTFSITVSGGTADVNVETDSGFWSIQESTSPETTYASGDSAYGLTAGSYCVYPSDTDGLLSGAITSAFTQDNVVGVDVLGFAGNTYTTMGFGSEISDIVFPVCTITNYIYPGTTSIPQTISLANVIGLDQVQIDGCSGLTSVLLPVGHDITNLSVQAAALPEVDTIINSFNIALAASIVINLQGGTNAARTAASDTVYNALISGGASITLNP